VITKEQQEKLIRIMFGADSIKWTLENHKKVEYYMIEEVDELIEKIQDLLRDISKKK